jgi:hypothetical protein
MATVYRITEDDGSTGKTPTSRTIPPAKAKELMLRQIREGKTVEQACKFVGKTIKSYEAYRKNDAEFRRSVDMIRAKIAMKGADAEVPEFEEFVEKYLHQKAFRHQLQWIDLIEGRRPREMHPNITWRPGAPDLIVCNTPPEHAKTTTLTVNYVAWRIAKDPNVKVIYVSRTATMAKKFLTQLKGILTHPRYEKFQQAFGPVEGWNSNSASWTQDQIYVSEDIRTSNAKDPTVCALGIRGQIYGSRADLIIIDDAVDGTNAHEFDKQIDWISGEVMSRLSASGVLLVVGTRMAPVDLYSELLKPEHYPDEESPWTYFAQPAVLEFADDPKDWVTLWPRSSEPEAGAKGDRAIPGEDGLWPKWDGAALAKRRSRMPPRKWAMVYMQQQVVDDAIFPTEAVNGCINSMRMPGLLTPETGWRKEGMAGLYVVAGLDPAMAGNSAAVVMGVDRHSRMRWVLDVYNGTTTPDDLRDLIKDWTQKYGIHEWRVEKNAFQIMLTQDREIRQFLAGRGCVLKEHFTGNNKWDVDFGVASMRDLFGTWRKSADARGWESVLKPLITFPTRNNYEPMKAMAEQLVTWYPDAPKSQKTDTVMALWFCEIRARELTDEGFGKFWLDNPYMPDRMADRRQVVDLDTYFVESQTPVIGMGH